MADHGLSRDIYGLCYKRSLIPKPVFFKGGTSTPEQVSERAAEVQKANDRRCRVNELSKDLRHELEKKDAFVFCIHYQMCCLDPTLQNTKVSRPTLVPSSRPDMEDEEEKLRTRLAEARDDFTNKMMAENLKCMGNLVARNGGYMPWHEEPRLLYRVTHGSSYTFFDADIGFCCPRWLQERDFGEPSRQDFINHMEGEPFASPYISLTESPTRALRFGKGMASAKVFIIDAVRLRAAKIHTERTTVLASRYATKPQYTTKSYWLAWFWVPADCLVKSVSFDEFQEVCKENNISNGMFPSR